jgi:hypothetical protein
VATRAQAYQRSPVEPVPAERTSQRPGLSAAGWVLQSGQTGAADREVLPIGRLAMARHATTATWPCSCATSSGRPASAAPYDGATSPIVHYRPGRRGGSRWPGWGAHRRTAPHHGDAGLQVAAGGCQLVMRRCLELVGEVVFTHGVLPVRAACPAVIASSRACRSARAGRTGSCGPGRVGHAPSWWLGRPGTGPGAGAGDAHGAAGTPDASPAPRRLLDGRGVRHPPGPSLR